MVRRPLNPPTGKTSREILNPLPSRFPKRLRAQAIAHCRPRLSPLRTPVNDQGVNIDDAAIAEIVRVTEGYPYFLQ
jgi:hypothetical protein